MASASTVAMADGRARVTCEHRTAVYGPLTLSLRGAHQVANALVAMRLLETARGRRSHCLAAPIEQASTTPSGPRAWNW